MEIFKGVSIVLAFRIPRHKGLMFEDNLGYVGRPSRERRLRTWTYLVWIPRQELLRLSYYDRVSWASSP